MKINLLYALLFLAASCGAPEAPQKVETTPTPESAPVASTKCYVFTEGLDTTAIQLTRNGNEVTGFYAWEPHQKDGARGQLTGKIEGDRITANFVYMIEGSIQKEEIVLKLENGKLMQGQGELEEKGGAMVLKDLTKLTWGDVFTEVDCRVANGPITNAQRITEMIQKEQSNK